MRTPRRKRPTEADLASLRQCHQTFIDLLAQLYPATPEYLALSEGLDAVRGVGVTWTGNPELWRGGDSRSRTNKTDFLERPPQGRRGAIDSGEGLGRGLEAADHRQDEADIRPIAGEEPSRGRPRQGCGGVQPRLLRPAPD